MNKLWLPLVLGLGFALPALADTTGECPSPRAELGIRYRFTAGDFLDAEDGSPWVRFLTEPSVTNVAPGGPADGRLVPGDAIVSVDGHLVTTEAGSRGFQFVSDGQKELLVRRRGELRKIRVSPVPRCGSGDPSGRSSGDPPPRGVPTPRLGVHFRCTDCGLDRVDGRGRWRFGSPPEIVSVLRGSPAEVAGLRPGDLLVAIDGLESTTPEGSRRFSELRAGEGVRLAFERGGERREVMLVVGRGR